VAANIRIMYPRPNETLRNTFPAFGHARAGAAFDGFSVGGMQSRLIVVDNPTSGAALCTNFSANGTTDGLAKLTGTVTNTATGTIYNGVTTQGPPATQDWIVTFSGIPDGTYTLTIHQGASMVNINVTVSSSNC
jgi:hypothetical protein